ncbi:hypothetical protein AMECASPLE_039657 [Ameca splendens]|uniref:Cystatin n=1 Tax=Ameca splendens TaxID=208324 RepID=A0ABV0Y8X1_9TELE
MDLPAGEHYATKEIQELCDQVKTKVEEITSRNLVEFKALIYREFKSLHFATYQVKVCVGEPEYFHVLFQRTVDQGEVKTTVEQVEQHHTKDDIIVPVNSQ